MHAKKTGRGHKHDSDDEVPYDGPEYSSWGEPTRTSMSKVDRDQLQLVSSQRRSLDDDEVETRPLPTVQKVATFGKQLEPSRTRPHGPGLEGLCTTINHAGNTIVVGCQNSKLLVIDAHTMQTMDTLDISNVTETPNAFKVPVVTACTVVRYLHGAGTKSNVLIAAQGHKVLHVHVSTGKVLSTLDEGPNSKVYNVVVRADSQAFATCGSDKAVRLYDEQTGKLTVSLDHGDNTTTIGHSNDVFGLAWHPEDPNILVSGGWDHTVQVWDVRLRRSVRSIYGPYICGDSLDIKGNTILAGSWRHSNPLELWDLASCKLLTRLPFHQPEQDACKLYSASFGRGFLDSYIIAGGSGKKACVKLFTQVGELIGTVPVASAGHSIESVGLPKDRFVSVCCANELHILDLSKGSS